MQYISKRHQSHVARALSEAQKSDVNFKLGCVLAKGSKVLVTGYNHQRSRIAGKMRCTCHAEVHAIHKFFTLHNRRFQGKKGRQYAQG